ncbi:hypothetical protein Dimus_025929 [Dionaea muscipula]
MIGQFVDTKKYPITKYVLYIISMKYKNFIKTMMYIGVQASNMASLIETTGPLSGNDDPDNQISDDGAQMEHLLPSSNEIVPPLGERKTEPSNIQSNAMREDIATSDGNSNSQGSDAGGALATIANVSLIAYQSSGSMTEQNPVMNTPDNAGLHFGTSDCYSGEMVGGPGSSVKTLSCKRKADEGSSGVSCSAGSSRYRVEISSSERDEFSAQTDASDAPYLSIHPEVPDLAIPQVTPINMVGTRASSDPRRPSGSVIVGVNNSNQQNGLPYVPVPEGHFPIYRDFPLHGDPIPERLNHPLQRRSQISSAGLHWNSSGTLGNSAPRNVPPIVSRGSSISSSTGGRFQVTREEESSRGSHPLFHRLLETGNPSLGPAIWGSEPESISTTGASSSQYRIAAGSHSWPPPCIPWHHNLAYDYVTSSHRPPSQSASNHFRSPIYSSPATFANLLSYGPQSDNHNQNVPALPSAAPNVSPTFPVDAAGRQSLVSQIRRVLRTMNGNEQRRPANLQEEVPNPMGLGLQTLIQSMLRIVDEEVGENARTDVDRMSYEQLLDVGRIGSRVSVGLTEEAISERLKQRTISPDDEVHLEGELCSVCLEKFAAGEDVGALICNHMFHIRCIKLWLRLKNLCPMCKRPALVEP